MPKVVASVLPAAEESSSLLVPASAPEDDVVVVPGVTEVVVSPVVVIDATEPPERPVPPGNEGPLQAGTRASKASLRGARTRASYAIRSYNLNSFAERNISSAATATSPN